MSYLVLARKYRPETFGEVVGQQTVARTLKNAIEMDRVPHACLFSGPRGIGKTTMARIFAKALDCEKGPTPEPCNECEICRSVWTGDDMDVVEIDGASNNSVEDIRSLRDKAQFTAARARYKIYIIDEVHMLSKAAFNALLKTLEEPPAHVKFIFATTELQKVPDTVQSRCQRFDFFPIKAEAIAARLEQLCEKESIPFVEGALGRIAEHSGGSMRDAESTLDQVISLGEGRVEADDVDAVLGTVSDESLFPLVEAALGGDGAAVLTGLHELSIGGADPHMVTTQLAGFVRDILVLKTCGKESELVGRTDSVRPKMVTFSQNMEKEPLLYATRLLCETEREMTRSLHPQIELEMCLLKLGEAENIQLIPDLIDRVERMASGGNAPTLTEAPKMEGPAPQATAPKPRPAETPPAPSVTAPTGLEGVKKAWGAIVSKLREMGRQATAAVLKETEPVKEDGKELIIGVNTGYKFHKDHLEEFENRQLVEDSIEAVLGKRYDIQFVTAGTSEPDKKNDVRTEKRSDRLVEDPIVKKAMEVLDASVVSIKEK